MKKQIAIQMDKIESIDYKFDTSFLIGYEAQQRNYDIFYYNPNDTSYNGVCDCKYKYHIRCFIDWIEKSQNCKCIICQKEISPRFFSTSSDEKNEEDQQNNDTNNNNEEQSQSQGEEEKNKWQEASC